MPCPALPPGASAMPPPTGSVYHPYHRLGFLTRKPLLKTGPRRSPPMDLIIVFVKPVTASTDFGLWLL